MSTLTCVALAAAVLLSAAPARADVQQWSELGVKRDLSKKASASLDLNIRFDDNVSRLGSFMPELGAQYQPKKWLRLGTGYRLQYERSGSGDMRARHRFFANVRPRYDIGEVRLEYRLQFQDQLRPDDDTDRWRQVLRNRLDVSYRDLDPYTPSVAIESHNVVDDGFVLEKIWLTAGVAFSRKDLEVDVFYRAELPQNDTMDPTVHIFGLGVHHDL